MKLFLITLLIINFSAFSLSEVDSLQTIDSKIEQLKKKNNPSDYEKALILVHRHNYDKTQAYKAGLEPEYRENDREVAIKILKKLTNDERALYVLASLTFSSDPESSESFFRKSAQLNYPPALHEVGLFYHYGHTGFYSVEQDDKKAFNFFKQATQAGSLRSQARLAYMYFEGKGVDRDTEKARLLYLDAAQKGLYRAYSRLAFDWYDRGALTPNTQKFNEYYNKYKNNEDREAQQSHRENPVLKEGEFLHQMFLHFEDFMI